MLAKAKLQIKVKFDSSKIRLPTIARPIPSQKKKKKKGADTSNLSGLDVTIYITYVFV